MAPEPQNRHFEGYPGSGRGFLEEKAYDLVRKGAMPLDTFLFELHGLFYEQFQLPAIESFKT
jgi:hypothetical protein